MTAYNSSAKPYLKHIKLMNVIFTGGEMTELQINEMLKDMNTDEKIYKSDPLKIPTRRFKKPKIIHYPISLANCGTTDGNIAVLEEFCQSLGIQRNLEAKNMLLCYNAQKSTFDLNQSRAKKVFIDRIKRVIGQCGLEQNQESHIDENAEVDGEDANEDDSHDKHFETTYLELRQALYNAHNLLRFVANMQSTQKLEAKDKFGRSMLHYAVENEHYDMIDLLFSAGCNPNAKENIGITPLCIPVIKGNLQLCEL